MKRSIITTLLALTALLQVQAQTNLTGRIYANSNIMADEMNKIVALVDQKIDSVRLAKLAEFEKTKKRKPNAKEKAEIEADLKKAKEATMAMKNGVKTAISVEFKDTRNLVMTAKISVDDNALKLAGVPWVKRKAMKAALAVMPTTQKATYKQQGNLIICEDPDEPDTLRLSADGKYIYGTFDKKQKFRLSRTK
ncbi:MAG: hypothetical protein IKO12_07825 [Bacteroidaceae bacterium]|nr:hypothetical protein [Bacteroidaceae bacterium]